MNRRVSYKRFLDLDGAAKCDESIESHAISFSPECGVKPEE